MWAGLRGWVRMAAGGLARTGRALLLERPRHLFQGSHWGRDLGLQAQGGEARGPGRHCGGLWFASMHSGAPGGRSVAPAAATGPRDRGWTPALRGGTGWSQGCYSRAKSQVMVWGQREFSPRPNPAAPPVREIPWRRASHGSKGGQRTCPPGRGPGEGEPPGLGRSRGAGPGAVP